jgi:hypothetical protein
MPRPASVVGCKHHRPRTVGKQHRYVAPARREIQVARLPLGPHHQNVPIRARFNELVGYRQGVEEARTLVSDVERSHLSAGNAEFALKQDATAGYEVIGTHRCKYNKIDFIGCYACPLKSNVGRHGTHRRRGFFTGFSEPPFADTGTFFNPGAVHSHIGRYFVVRDNALGQVVANTSDSGIYHELTVV